MIAKRNTDIVFSTFALICSSPIMLLITILLIVSKEKVLEVKKINGYKGTESKLYNFNITKDSNEISNPVLKHVTTEYNSGTSYGLRICTRFSTVGNNSNIITDIIPDNSADYENMCSMISKMNENLSKMLDITKSAINNTQGYKDLIQIIKNNRTNVPYIKTINGESVWFVNGRMVSTYPIKNAEA